MTLRWMAAAALLVASLTACAEGEAGQARKPSAAVRDSAGVRIVENTGIARAAELQWTVGDAPALELGAAENPVLNQVTGACRRADGSIVVASSGTQRLEVFAAEGRHVRSIGREGDGPGEFRSVFFVGCLPGDSVGAWDPLLGRLSVFGPGGEYARAASPTALLGGPLPRVHGLLPGGRFVLAVGGTGGFPASGRVARDTAEWLVLDAAGNRVASLGRFASTEQIAHADAAGMLVRPLPFGRSTVSAVHGDALYAGSGDAYEVSVYDGRGELRSRIRADRTRLPVTRQDVEAYRRELVTIGGDARSRQRQAALLDGAPYPQRMPAMTALQVDGDGNVWVQEAQPHDAGPAQFWTVFAPDGIVRGTVRLPRDLRVTQIGPDWVVGLALGEDGDERVRLYGLRKGSAP